MSPVDFANEASRYQYKLWGNRDLTLRPVITYVYFCVGDIMHPVDLTFQTDLLE
jgi:hypothetical protein